MKNKSKSMHFFLGSSSPRGFYSKFNYLYEPGENWSCKILKGSPGCGKSSLLKRIGVEGEKNNLDIEYIYCSFDPNSLDAVIFPSLNTCIVDGTSPHVLDPEFPGACEEIINLGEYWDKSILKDSKKDIIKSSRNYLACIEKSKKYLAAYGAITTETTENVIENIDFGKIKLYSKILIKKIFSEKINKNSRQNERFLSAFSYKGIFHFEKNLKSFDNIYEISDEFGICGGLVLKYIKNSALTLGYDIISCYSPLAITERLEALFIPEISSVIVVSSKLLKLSEKIKTEKIDSVKFYENEKTPIENKFNEQLEKQLLNETMKIMDKGKKFHDEIESFYIKAMNFESVNNLTEKIISELF